MPWPLSRLPGPWRWWAARWWVPALFLAALAGLWCWLPPRPLVTVVCPGRTACPFFSADGKLLLVQPWALGGPAEPVRLWELPGGREVAGPAADGQVTGLLDPGAEGDLLLERHVEGERSSLRLVQMPTGREWLRLECGSRWWYCRSLDGGKLAVTPAGPADAGMEVWDVGGRRREARLGPGCPLALSPDGRTLVSFLGPNRGLDFTVWDVAQEQQRGRIPIPDGGPHAVRFSPDGRTLAVNGGGSLRLWDVEAGRERATLPQADCFHFVLGGRVLAATGSPPSFGARVRCWDVTTGREVGGIALSPPAGEAVVASLQASPDGWTLVAEALSEVPPRQGVGWLLKRPWQQEGKQRRKVGVFDAATGRELGTLAGSGEKGQGHYVFSPDGRLLAVSRGDVVEVWQVPPRRPVVLAVGVSGLCVLAVLLLVRWASRRSRKENAVAPPGCPPPPSRS